MAPKSRPVGRKSSTKSLRVAAKRQKPRAPKHLPPEPEEDRASYSNGFSNSEPEQVTHSCQRPDAAITVVNCSKPENQANAGRLKLSHVSLFPHVNHTRAGNTQDTRPSTSSTSSPASVESVSDDKQVVKITAQDAKGSKAGSKDVKQDVAKNAEDVKTLMSPASSVSVQGVSDGKQVMKVAARDAKGSNAGSKDVKQDVVKNATPTSPASVQSVSDGKQMKVAAQDAKGSNAGSKDVKQDVVLKNTEEGIPRCSVNVVSSVATYSSQVSPNSLREPSPYGVDEAISDMAEVTVMPQAQKLPNKRKVRQGNAGRRSRMRPAISSRTSAGSSVVTRGMASKSKVLRSSTMKSSVVSSSRLDKSFLIPAASRRDSEAAPVADNEKVRDSNRPTRQQMKTSEAEWRYFSASKVSLAPVRSAAVDEVRAPAVSDAVAQKISEKALELFQLLEMSLSQRSQVLHSQLSRSQFETISAHPAEAESAAQQVQLDDVSTEGKDSEPKCDSSCGARPDDLGEASAVPAVQVFEGLAETVRRKLTKRRRNRK